jgi:hypothetical protein
MASARGRPSAAPTEPSATVSRATVRRASCSTHASATRRPRAAKPSSLPAGTRGVETVAIGPNAPLALRVTTWIAAPADQATVVAPSAASAAQACPSAPRRAPRSTGAEKPAGLPSIATTCGPCTKPEARTRKRPPSAAAIACSWSRNGPLLRRMGVPKLVAPGTRNAARSVPLPGGEPGPAGGGGGSLQTTTAVPSGAIAAIGTPRRSGCAGSVSSV